MPEEPNIDPELTRLAASLAGLTPATPALDRDRLFYEAGRRTRPVAARPWGWPLATTLTAALAFGLGIRLASAPTMPSEPQIVERHVPLPVSPAPSQATVRAATVRDSLYPAADALRRRKQQMLWDAETLPALHVSVPTESVESQLGIKRSGLTDVELHRFKAALSRGDI
jgi:hypothetical protein